MFMRKSLAEMIYKNSCCFRPRQIFFFANEKLATRSLAEKDFRVCWNPTASTVQYPHKKLRH